MRTAATRRNWWAFVLVGIVGALTVAVVVIALGAWLLSGSGPPDGDAFRPLPPGVELVGERDWCAEDEPVARYGYLFRPGMCVHEIDVRRPGASARQLYDELQAHYRDVVLLNTDHNRVVVLADDPGLVTLVDGEGW